MAAYWLAFSLPIKLAWKQLLCYIPVSIKTSNLTLWKWEDGSFPVHVVLHTSITRMQISQCVHPYGVEHMLW